MKLTYHGHSCFVIDAKGYKIAIDPYDGVPGYGDLHIEAHEVLCSHDHDDHGNRGAVKLLPKKESPFTITAYDSFHDNEKGALRGKNTIHLFAAEGLRIAHMGDMGCMPNDAQVKALKNLDAIMIPVGGTYTIDAVQAKGILRILAPKMIIPMHYHLGDLGFETLAHVRAFTDLYEEANFLEGNEIEINGKGKGQVVVPKFLKTTKEE